MPPSAGVRAERARLYDALATPRAERSTLPLPKLAEVWQRLSNVRQRVEQRLVELAGSKLETSQLPAGEFSLPLVVQHEAQHQETMLQAIALRTDLRYAPSYALGAATQSAACSAQDRIAIPAGPFIMGTADRAC